MSATCITTPIENAGGAETLRQPSKKMVELRGLGPVWDALLAAQEDEARATKLREDLEKIVKDRMGEAEIGLLNGQPVVTYSNGERIILRTKLVRERHPDVARECEDIIPVRVFRLLKP